MNPSSCRVLVILPIIIRLGDILPTGAVTSINIPPGAAVGAPPITQFRQVVGTEQPLVWQTTAAAAGGGKPTSIVDTTRKPGLELLNQPGFHPDPVVAQACGNEQPIAGGIETSLLTKNPTEVMKQRGEQLGVG